MIDIVVPATRKGATQRLINSLALGTQVPDQITVVSNEIDSLEPRGLNVRIIKFNTDFYGVGYRDVALRCNIGVFSSEHSYVLISGDDQIAAPDTVRAFSHKLESGERYVWGHHRFTTFAGHSVEEIMAMPASAGRSREQGANRMHGYYSAYSGSFGAEINYLKGIGAFDMAFNCRHAGEDQHLGLRTGGSRVFIHEPPFWWHPEEAEDWGRIMYTNVCGRHSLYEERVSSGLEIRKCHDCPYTEVVDEQILFTPTVWIPYRHELVETNVINQ